MILQNEKLRVQVLPELGATLGEFSYQHQGTFVDIFRKADANNPSLKNISFFIMGPWIARIPDRKFFWEGKELTLQHPGDPVNAIHGIFRQFPWQEQFQTKDSVGLILNFKNGDKGYTFVSDFQANIIYQIVDSTLKVTISLKNISEVPIPCSFGSHPMILKRKENAVVKFAAKKWFPVDSKLLVPKGYIENIPPTLNAPEEKEMPADWDHCLANWDGEAAISWPNEKLKLILGKVDTASTFLQCWSGAEREVFALEQQTAPANSFNLLHQGVLENGVKILNPTEEFKVIHTFTIRSL